MLVTKSKNDYAIVWSVIALVMAVCSIVYCFSPVLEIMGDKVERSNRAIVYLTRLLKGSV